MMWAMISFELFWAFFEKDAIISCRCGGFCAMMQMTAVEPCSQIYTGKNKAAHPAVDEPNIKGNLL